MGTDVAKDYQGLTVHAVSFHHERRPVFYASMPCANETLKGCGANGAGDKHHLASALWNYLVAMESPLWKRYQSADRAAFPIQVVRDLLGKPHLLLGEYRGPAISFSEGGGKVWVALCGDESDIGIDVAGTDEFHGEYPFHRVFHSQELQHALRLAGGRFGASISPTLVCQGSRCQGPGMCISSRGSSAHHRLSVGRGRRRVHLSGGLIREGPRAVSLSCQPFPMGTFASSEEGVAFHRPFNWESPATYRLQGGELHSATSMRRLAEIFNTGIHRGKMLIHDERS